MRYFITTSELITRLNSRINSIGNRVGPDAWMDYITSAIKFLRAGRILPWMKKSYSLSVFSNVYKYPLQDDFNALVNAIPALRSGNTVGQQLTFSTEKEFNRIPSIGIALGWENGQKYLLLKASSALNDEQIEEFDDEATDYTLAGDASNPVYDPTNFRSGESSLKFDVADVTHAFTISRTLSESIDLSEIFNLGTAFIDIFMPTVITSLKLRIGNDVANYYETPIITEQYCDNDFTDNWNQLGINLDQATEVGTVDLTKIDYYEVIGDNTGVSDKGFRVDALYVRAGASQSLSFNSYDIVKKSATENTWQSVVNDVNNLILWDEDYDDLLLYQALKQAGFFNYKDVSLMQVAENEYTKLFSLFENRFPSQEARNKTNYYQRANRF
jgi:hypothetical protein